MKVVKNFLWNSSYQLFILIVPFITIPYISRVLGPSGIGINAYTNSIIQYFILIGSLGFSLYGNREIAYNRGNKQAYTNIFWEIIILRALMILFSSILFIIFILVYTDYRVAFIMQYFSLFAVIFDVSWFFMGMENFRVTVTRNIIVKLLSVAAIFIFIKDKNDVTMYILIISISTLLGNFTMFPYLKRYLVSVKLLNLKIWRHLKPSLILFIPQIAINVYVILNKTMLGKIDSVTAAGYFDNSDKVIKILLAIITATGTVMLPHIANAYANGELQKIKKFLKFFFDFVSFLSIPLMFGIMAVSNNFVIWFFGNEFAPVGTLMQIEALVIPVMAWSNVVGAQYLLPENRNKDYTVAVTVGAFLNLFLNIPLILMWGVNGAALATVISEIGVTGYELYIISSEIKIIFLFKDVWKYILSGMLMFVIISVINNFLKFGFFVLILDSLVGLFCYIIILSILKSSFLKDLIYRFNNYKDNRV